MSKKASYTKNAVYHLYLACIRCAHLHLFSAFRKAFPLFLTFLPEKIPKSVDFVLHPSNSDESKDASKQDIKCKETFVFLPKSSITFNA